MPRRRPLIFAFALFVAMILILFSLFAYRRLWYTHIDLASFGSYPFDDLRGRLEEIPESVRRMDGRRVKVDGYMIPLEQNLPIAEFALVPFLWSNLGMPRESTRQSSRILGRIIKPGTFRISFGSMGRFMWRLKSRMGTTSRSYEWTSIGSSRCLRCQIVGGGSSSVSLLCRCCRSVRS